MVDVDKQIASWRKQFLNDNAFYSDEVEELESHIRDAIDRLVAEGYTEREAFLEATRLLGDPTMLRREYKNSRPLAERLFVPAAIVAVATFLLPLLVVFLDNVLWWNAAIYLSFKYIYMTPIGHTFLAGFNFLALFFVIWAGALRMPHNHQRRFALTGAGLLMGLIFGITALHATLVFPWPDDPMIHSSMPSLVLLCSVFFKGPQLVKAASVLAAMASLFAAHQLLAFGFGAMMLVLPLSDILLGLIVGIALAKRQTAESLRLA